MIHHEATPTPPTPEEINQAANVLSRLTPGFLPKPIFLETARLCTTPIVELVPVRNNNGTTEVLLFKRDDDDPTWPGQLHTPGTVVRATDEGDGFHKPFQRLYADELQFQPEPTPRLVTQTLHKVARGTELATIFYVDLTNSEPPVGKWYPADELPDSLVETQRGFIAEAVKAFKGGHEQ